MSVDEEWDITEDEHVEPRLPEEFDEDDNEDDAEPRSRWSSASEIAGGLLALVLVTIGVWVAYLAFGLGFALVSQILTIAAPAVIAMGAALFLARFLSRR